MPSAYLQIYAYAEGEALQNGARDHDAAAYPHWG